MVDIKKVLSVAAVTMASFPTIIFAQDITPTVTRSYRLETNDNAERILSGAYEQVSRMLNEKIEEMACMKNDRPSLEIEE
jgi:hypothetical protein